MIKACKYHGKKSLFLLFAACTVFFTACQRAEEPPETTVIPLRDTVTVEAGEPLPDAAAFLREGETAEVAYGDVSSVLTDVPGTYPVTLVCGGEARSVSVCVVDTIPPEGMVQALTAFHPDAPTPEDFVTKILDATAVSVRYETEPDMETPGEQPVTVLLTDAGGNVTKLQAVLTVIIDHEAPVIEGVRNISLYAGDTVAYRTGITVTDDQDEAPQLTVASDTVDLSAVGQYAVTYTATDHAGNSSSVTATVSVYERKDDYVDVETIYEAVDVYLDFLIKDGMTDREKVEIIAYWIRNNTRFVSYSNKDDWMQEAYRMLRNRQGDCFSYFSLTKLMLERLGIPNIDVQKVPNYEGDSRHYWSLVSVDGGETWYHLDVAPRSDPTRFILVTDAYLDRYSAWHNNCYNRDKSLYPATPEN